MESEGSSVESWQYVPEVLVASDGNSETKETSMEETSLDTEISPGHIAEPNISDYRMMEIKLKLAESTGNNKTEEFVDFPDFEALFNGTLPCTLLYFDRNTRSLSQIRTFDELAKYVGQEVKTRKTDNSVLRTLVSAPATQLVHFATLGKYLRYLYETDKLMDVCIEVDGTIFLAHRVALCCCSEYFSSFLMKKKYPKIPVHIKIIGVSADAFSAFLEFVYTGEVIVHHGFAGDLFQISEHLDVKTLKNRLEEMSWNLSSKEAVKLLLLRQHGPADQLYEAAFTKVVDQFMHASLIPGFLDLDVETFCRLLKSDDLRVSREFEVFQVAVRWIVHGARARLQHVASVMTNVRFCQMSHEELFNCLVETRLFVEYTELTNLILIANWILTAIQMQREDPFHFEVAPPRRYYVNKPRLHSPKMCPNNNTDKFCRVSKAEKLPDKLISKPNLVLEEESDCRRAQHGAAVYSNPCCSKKKNNVDSKSTPGETSRQQKCVTRDRHGKPVLLAPELASSHMYFEMIERQTRSTLSTPRYGKPVLLQQECTKSTVSPLYGVSDSNTLRKCQTSDNRPQTRTISHAGHSKPTMWSPDANQSSNNPPEAEEIPSNATKSRHSYQDMLNQKTERISPPVSELPALGIVRCKSVVLTASQKVEIQNCLTHETATTTKEESDKSLPCDSPGQKGQRYVISPLPPRPARPVVLPTEVQTAQEVRKVQDIRLLPDMSHHYQALADIIVVGAFEKEWLLENDENGRPSFNESFMQYCDIPVPLRYFAVAMVMRNVYVIGGYDPTPTESCSGVTNTMVKMDCINKRWRIAEPMLEARMCHCACALGNNIYVFGGLDNKERPLSSCEFYNTCTNQWSHLMPLPVPIYAGTAASLGGKCYIAGGLTRAGQDNSIRMVMTMVCFNPRSNSWTFIGHLRMPLCHASLVNVQGRLYLCGGATQRGTGRRHELVSVGCIDEFNFLNNTWSFRAEMTTKRHEASVAVVGSRLYIIGGKSSATENVVRSIECFDTRNSAWIKCPLEMPFPVRWMNCVTYKND